MTEKRKNIIWIFGDQHRAQALSCNGDPNVATPHLDRMSREGVNFNRAVSGFPLCCPFRGSLLTSQYPHNCVPGHEYPLPRGMKTIAHAFSDEGYETAWFGKWHLAGWKERDGRAAYYIVPEEDRGGFDTWIGYDNNNSQWDCHVHGHRKDGTSVERYRLPGYETDCLTDMLIDFLKNRSDGDAPFFASLSVQPPHDPYIAPAEYIRNYNPSQLEMRPNVPHIPRVQQQARQELAGAYAQIENLDYNVGRVREALAETGLEEDTYIVFFSDHGDMHGSQGQFRKTNPFEESIRIPFLISTGPTRYNHRSWGRDSVINHVDIAPTTLGLVGIDKPEWMVGYDYSGMVFRNRESTAPPESAFLQNVIPTGHGNSCDRPYRGVVTRDGWKYVALEGQPWLLFNLNEDPYEQANLAHNSQYRQQRNRLNDLTREWIESTGDAFELPEL
ncbi:MAG: sulfatase [Candidatus Sumerlaeota bacterium]